jgi:hypothetical protein
MFKNKKIAIFSIIFFVFFFLLSFDAVLASDPFGAGQVDETIVLEASDPRSIASRIINISLGFLSIIAVSLIILAGFLWMTSGGNEEKVTKAKNILKNALIGLIIVLSAWGIVSFILRSLDPSDPAGHVPPSTTTFFQQGSGAMGNCSLESVYPSPGQEEVPRNTNIMITFKEEVDIDTLNENTVVICEEDNFDIISHTCSVEHIDFSVNTNDDKIFVLNPSQYLGNEDGFTDYVVYLTNGIEKIDGTESIFEACSPQYYTWGFEVSNELDLDPPQVESVFPTPDNEQDYIETTESSNAEGSIMLTGDPNHFLAAYVSSISPTTNIDSVVVDAYYSDACTDLTVTVLHDESQVQVSCAVEGSLGAFNIVNNKISLFNSSIVINLDSVVAGNSWNIKIEPMVPADTIKVAHLTYTFVEEGEGGGYNIEVNNFINETALNIVNALSNHPSVTADIDSENNTTIKLKALVAGSSGDDIHLSSSNEHIDIVSFSGGSDAVQQVDIKDKLDQPRNAIIQINFNEAVNPLKVSGHSSDVGDYIRVVNLSDNNEVVPGTFSISSDYTTVEFQSDEKCGANACGEDIFCLPGNSNLRVELMAADLEAVCDESEDCAHRGEFSECMAGFCSVPEEGDKRYPAAAVPFTGIVDAAGNSFDGNADGFSRGPDSFYNLNIEDSGHGDNLSWSFWTSNVIATEPPVIVSIYPDYEETAVDLFDPIEILFDSVMMLSSLRTGKTNIGGVDHPLVNLISPQPVGYWISSENIDIDNSGAPDETKSFINHAKFYELVTYSAQVGSGVRDIYQNCFKPSAGPECVPTINKPFCCNGEPSVSCD